MQICYKKNSKMWFISLSLYLNHDRPVMIISTWSLTYFTIFGQGLSKNYNYSTLSKVKQSKLVHPFPVNTITPGTTNVQKSVT